MKAYKRITIVDENNVVVGYEDYTTAIEKGLLRRGVVVFIKDSNGRHLIQKRSKTISYPGLLEAAASGHVDEGDADIEAAHKELFEEVSLRDVPLVCISADDRTNDMYSSIYVGIVSSEDQPVSVPEEVEELYWLTTKEVDDVVMHLPELFTVYFCERWKKLRDKIIAS